jgi:phage terminase large subunit-like protein
MSIKLYKKYIQDVTTGKRQASERERLSVLRHVNDLKNKSFDYYFDEKEADIWIEQISMFRLVEGPLAGELFPIQPFQAFIVASIFGWKHKKTKLRRFNDAYIQIPKKNAKSTLMAAIIAAMFFLEDEGMGQYIFAATSRKQASICFKVAKAMIKKYIFEYDIKDMVSMSASAKDMAQNILHLENLSTIETASKEADSVEGRHSSAAVADEYHLHKDDEIVNNLKSGMGGRPQPLMLRITTPGNNLFAPCFGYSEYCGNVLKGMFTDERLFAIFYEMDPGDDIYDPKMWVKANPNIGESPRWDFLHAQALQARNLGGVKEVDFKTKHCGLWVSSSDTWIRDEIVNRCVQEYEYDDYIGAGGMAGLDLAETKDILAFVMHMDDGTVIPRYFITEKKLYEKTDGVDYQIWAEQGHLIISHEYGGEVMDYNLVEDVIVRDVDKYKIRKIYYDRRFAASLVQRLSDRGVKCAAYGQGFGFISPALAKLEDDILKQKIRFKDPVTRWMFTNVRIAQNDNGQRRVVRDSRTQKIDGVIALIMCKAAELIEPKPKKPKIFVLNTTAKSTAT